MIFSLVDDHGDVVHSSDHPDDLHYAALHHCTRWSVHAKWPGCAAVIALVNWRQGYEYVFTDPYTGEGCIIKEHAHIIPMVRGTLCYNDMFGRYANPETARCIFVHPVGE